MFMKVTSGGGSKKIYLYPGKFLERVCYGFNRFFSIHIANIGKSIQIDKRGGSMVQSERGTGNRKQGRQETRDKKQEQCRVQRAYDPEGQIMLAPGETLGTKKQETRNKKQETRDKRQVTRTKRQDPRFNRIKGLC